MNGPETRVILQLKTGRRFFVWALWVSPRIEHVAQYRTPKGHQVPRYLRGYFDFVEFCEIDWNGVKKLYPFYRQRSGRHQPRFDRVPSEWELVSSTLTPKQGITYHDDSSKDDRFEQRPIPPLRDDLFSSPTLFEWELYT